MKEPKWPYSWDWTEADEIRLSSAAKKMESLANELSSLATSYCTQGKNFLSSDLISDAGTHYEDELTCWKQKMDSEVVSNLRVSAAAIRNTIAERQTLWDMFQTEVKNFLKWQDEHPEG